MSTPFKANFAPYPKVLYHAKLAPITVNSAEDEEALGDDWFDNPWEPKGEDRDGNKLEEAPKPRGRKPKADGA